MVKVYTVVELTRATALTVTPLSETTSLATQVGSRQSHCVDRNERTETFRDPVCSGFLNCHFRYHFRQSLPTITSESLDSRELEH